jgi:predicted metal-dependent phosphoesterase TrpH
MHEGVCKNFREAFAKYLAFGGPAYVSHYKLLPEEAVKLIGEVGGIAVLAHPGGLNREANLAKLNALLPPLVAAGLAGVEAYYPTHSSEQVNYYLGLAAEWGLLVTGGSDFHGESSVREVVFGEFALADEYVDKLKQKIRERV